MRIPSRLFLYPVVLTLLLVISAMQDARAQQNVGIGTLTPDSSSILELRSTNQGLLIPRMDSVQRLAIVTPANGLLVFDVNYNQFYVYYSGAWHSIGATGPGGPGLTGPTGPTGATGATGSLAPGLKPGDTPFWNGVEWVTDNYNIYNDSANVGIGTATPAAKLEVQGTGTGASTYSFQAEDHNSNVTMSVTDTGSVGIGIVNPDPSALLDLTSIDRGLLLPRMTDTERNAIPKPAYGLTIFDTTDSTLQFYNGSCWIRSFQHTCNDCLFTLTPSSTSDTINRVKTDSAVLTLTIKQTNGSTQNIAVSIFGTLPTGVTASIAPNPILGSGTVTITFYVTSSSPSGTFPVIIQAFCGVSTYSFVYSLTLTPCYDVNVINSTNNYNLATAMTTEYGPAILNSPVCVLNTVEPGVTISSLATNQPSYTIGAIPKGSLIELINNGNIIGLGGNGGTSYDPTSGSTGAGFNGGNAVQITENTTIQNNGTIYGGGGGGDGLGFSLNLCSLIGIGNCGLLIGAGGGGGDGGGLGGNITGFTGYVEYAPGTNGGVGPAGVPGVGGAENFPINIGVSVATININPDVYGGNGGPYGGAGTQGTFNLSISATISIIITFTVGPFNIPLPVPVPSAGTGGYAIQLSNGAVINIPNNPYYNTAYLKGQVGP